MIFLRYSDGTVRQVNDSASPTDILSKAIPKDPSICLDLSQVEEGVRENWVHRYTCLLAHWIIEQHREVRHLNRVFTSAGALNGFIAEVEAARRYLITADFEPDGSLRVATQPSVQSAQGRVQQSLHDRALARGTSVRVGPK